MIQISFNLIQRHTTKNLSRPKLKSRLPGLSDTHQPFSLSFSPRSQILLSLWHGSASTGEPTSEDETPRLAHFSLSPVAFSLRLTTFSFFISRTQRGFIGGEWWGTTRIFDCPWRHQALVSLSLSDLPSDGCINMTLFLCHDDLSGNNRFIIHPL